MNEWLGANRLSLYRNFRNMSDDSSDHYLYCCNYCRKNPAFWHMCSNSTLSSDTTQMYLCSYRTYNKLPYVNTGDGQSCPVFIPFNLGLRIKCTLQIEVKLCP